MASTKKTFTEDLEAPAELFITKPGKPVKEAPAGETRDPAPAGYKTNPLYIETRSKRLQLLVQPSLLEKLRARATREGRSLNDLIHTILEEATK